jgi:hypothetical protein
MLTGNARAGVLEIPKECVAHVLRERQSRLPAAFASNS